jgi:DNA-binding IclR family transcriptional regulator
MEFLDRLGEVVPPRGRMAPAYPIGSVDNTLRILLLLRGGRRLSIAEVAAELSIARSSAHRLMAMLVHYDFVRQDLADRSYGIGPAVVDIGLSAARSLDLRVVARPVLAQLAEETRLTAHLVLPRGREALFIEGVESRGAIRAVLRTGTTLPIHVVGAGKAILATMTDEQLRDLYRDAAPEPVTGRALHSVDALLRDAAAVRQRGYAVNRGESEIGVLAMGVAVVSTDPDVLAGLSVSGPDFAEGADWEERTATALKRAAAELAKSIRTFLG